ncbi:hypothetical protein ACSFCP_004359, partial [Yersinia enterocolitica]
RACPGSHTRSNVGRTSCIIDTSGILGILQRSHTIKGFGIKKPTIKSEAWYWGDNSKLICLLI